VQEARTVGVLLYSNFGELDEEEELEIAETMTDEKKNGVEEDFQTEKANQAISNSAGETADEMPELEGEVITPVMEDPDLNRDTSIPMMDLSLLTSMVDESIQDNRDVLAQHEISLLSDIPADTPRILALPSQAGSVISRILRNFVENSPTGSSITINAVPDGEFVNLHLKHSIDPENAANLGPGNVEETITYPYGFAREDWEQVVKQISTFNGEVLFNPIPPNQEEVTIKFRTA
jgi:signal transduction histidine kinase